MSSSELFVKWHKKGISLRGDLDDRTPQKVLAHLLPLNEMNDQLTEFNLQGLRRGNSRGILEWIAFTNKIKFPFYYTHAQFWMVNYFNIIANYFECQNGYVHSFYVPFYCEEIDSTINQLLVVGKDISLLSSYDQFKMEDLRQAPYIYNADFDPRRYFKFLATNKDFFESFARKNQITTKIE